MNRSGLIALRAGVAAYFVANGISATVSVSWRARSRQDNQGPGGANRVVFIPGEFDASTGTPKPLRAGRLDREGPQDHVNLDPRMRALAWWHESVTCSVWAADTEAPDDDERQIASTESLLESTIQGIHNAVDPQTNTPIGFGNIEEIGDAFWTVPETEQAFGRELTFGFVLLVPIFDAPTGLGYPQPSVARGAVT